MSTKAKIQKVRAEVEAHEDRGWLRGYEEGLAKREQQIVDLQSALEARDEQIRELLDAVKKRNEQIQELGRQKNGPRTAREALALAWELAHPVKEGQELPEGTEHIRQHETGFFVRALTVPYVVTSWVEVNTRTLDPLPNPEPEWLKAPAVMAHTDNDDTRRVWTALRDEQWASTKHTYTRHWSALRDVTPLYPKEDQS